MASVTTHYCDNCAGIIGKDVPGLIKAFRVGIEKSRTETDMKLACSKACASKLAHHAVEDALEAPEPRAITVFAPQPGNRPA